MPDVVKLTCVIGRDGQMPPSSNGTRRMSLRSDKTDRAITREEDKRDCPMRRRSRSFVNDHIRCPSTTQPPDPRNRKQEQGCQCEQRPHDGNGTERRRFVCSCDHTFISSYHRFRSVLSASSVCSADSFVFTRRPSLKTGVSGCLLSEHGCGKTQVQPSC